MANELTAPASGEGIQSLILTVRGQRVMLDADLARIYGVTTGRLNQAVRRNAARFPEDFAFRLDRQEFAGLMSQIVISNSFHIREKAPAYRARAQRNQR